MATLTMQPIAEVFDMPQRSHLVGSCLLEVLVALTCLENVPRRFGVSLGAKPTAGHLWYSPLVLERGGYALLVRARTGPRRGRTTCAASVLWMRQTRLARATVRI